MKNTIYPLWPVMVGEFYNPNHALIKNELVNFFEEYEKKRPLGNSQLNDKNYSGNYNLYQSDYNLHNEENTALQNVLKFIGSRILDMSKKANQITLKNLDNNNSKVDLKLLETWFIRYNKGGFVYPHKHDGCSWCCVYYVQIGSETKKMNGSTFFLRPYQGESRMDFGGSYLREDTAVFKAEEGKLLIWPNYLYHGSHPFTGNKDRIIISANSVIQLTK
ncbi:2OG-Fe(II) oxygenase family protein [Candidatus Pelagibacter sp.]|nr:2OG-Fe(II) oxygenase family protein [Candidatus Pelagibacter sp.]